MSPGRGEADGRSADDRSADDRTAVERRSEVARWTEVALAAGVLAGLALAASGILEPARPGPVGIPGDAVAVVDGRPITQVQYRRALDALSADRREPSLDNGLRRQVLERLIDDELLVQRGLELGLAARDPRVRADLGSAVVSQLTAQARAEEPDAATLERFYSENQSFFAQPPRIRVRQSWFADRAEAESARARWLAGLEIQSEPAPVPVPDALLPVPKLRDYLGATGTRFATTADIGAISPVLGAVGGYRLVQVRERRPAKIRDLADIRDLVRAEYLRRAGERRVRAFLDRRRARADISIAEDRL